MKALNISSKGKLYGVVFSITLLSTFLLSILIPSKALAAIGPIFPDPTQDNGTHRSIVSRPSNWWGPDKFTDRFGEHFVDGTGHHNCVHPTNYPPGDPPSNPAQDNGACATGLNANDTRYKLFKSSSAPRTTTNLVIDDGCKDIGPYRGIANGQPFNKNDNPNASHPNKGNRRVVVEIRETRTNGSDGGTQRGPNYYNYTGGDCSGNNLVVSVPDSAFTLEQQNRYTNAWRTALVKVYKWNGTFDAGHQMFTLRYAAGTVVGDDDGYFAMASTKAKGNPNVARNTRYFIPFKLDCRYRDGQDITLRFYGTDYENVGVQRDSWPEFIVRDLGDNSIVFRATRSNGEVLADQNYTIPGNRLDVEGVYRVEIENVDVGNGFRVGLPFSEFTNYTCPQPTGPRFPVANCKAIGAVGSPTDFRLRFISPDSGRTDTSPQVFNRSGTIVDPFKSFPTLFMFPHFRYIVQMVNPAGTAVYAATALNNFNRCINADCEVGITGTGIVPPIEPGRSARMSYGIWLNNQTNQTYTGVNSYRVQVTAPGVGNGLIVNGSTNYVAPTPPGLSRHQGPFDVTANYRGTLHADLFWNNVFNLPLNTALGLNNRCNAPYTPQTRPSIRVSDGDLATGGGFEYLSGGVSQCPAINNARRFIAPSSKGNVYSGGARAFAFNSGNPYNKKLGSMADFGVYALGLVDGSATGQHPNAYGFFSTGKTGALFDHNKLAFAHPISGGQAGLLGGGAGSTGTNPNAHCVKDFYSTTRKTTSPVFAAAGATINPDTLPANPEGQYFYNGPVNISGTLSANKRYTIYVNGNVNITNNITYGAWTIDGVGNSNAPYLTIIAKGNIHVYPAVNRIDGLFIAQPSDNDLLVDSTGIFSTCSPGGLLPTKAQYANAAGGLCQSNLTINGSVIAQHLYPLRAIGTLNGAAPNGDPPAENIVFNPAFIVGQPNFKSLSSANNDPPPIDELYSLPPIF